jgi:hypothetical protein
MPRTKQAESNILNGLSEDQRIALHFQHMDSVEELKTELAAANSRYRNARKGAKADLGEEGLAEIDEALRQATPEGEAKAKSQIDRMMRVARWHGSQIGAQMSILDTPQTRTPGNRPAMAMINGISAPIMRGRRTSSIPRIPLRRSARSRPRPSRIEPRRAIASSRDRARAGRLVSTPRR